MAMGLGGNPPQKRWFSRALFKVCFILGGRNSVLDFDIRWSRANEFVFSETSSIFIAFFSHGLVPMMQWFLLLPGPEVHHCPGVTGRFRDPLTSQHGQDIAWRETPRQLCSEQETSKRPRSIYFGVVPRTNNIYIYSFIYLYIYLSMNILY